MVSCEGVEAGPVASAPHACCAVMRPRDEVSVRRRDQLPVLHTRTVKSKDPVTRVHPSGEKAHDHTVAVWPVRMRRRDQSPVPHTRTVQSIDPVTRVPPSGEKAHDFTSAVWPVRVRRRDQSLVAHTRTVRS
eukprot:1176363-Prorocentrum_minimum.AAC.4